MHAWRWGTGLVIVVLGVGAGSAVWARQNPTPLVADGSVAALTAEVRALRLSLEAAAKDQVQVQGLGVYLSVQKDRLLQVVARLDAARRDTASAVEAVRRTAGDLAMTEKYLAENPTLAADRRADLERAIRMQKQEAERAQQTENDARLRETQAEQAVATEEARWTELVGRLEQSIRKS